MALLVTKQVPVPPYVAPRYVLAPGESISEAPKMHFDASDLNGNGDSNAGWSNEDPIPLWKDRTQTYSIRNTTVARQPEYLTNGINSIPTANFNTTSHLRLRNYANDADVNNVTLPSGDFIIYFVVEYTAVTGGTTYNFIALNSTADVYGGYIYWGTGGSAGKYNMYTSTGGNNFNNTLTVASSPYILTFAQTPDGSCLQTESPNCVIMKIWKDGDGGFSSYGGTAASRNFGTVNVAHFGHATSCQPGYWSEIIIFESNPSSADTTIIEDYLTTKYDIT